MKKFAMVIAIAATLVGNVGHAQTTNKNNMKTGNAAQSGGTYSTTNFAWGIGLGALAAVGVVVGLTAGYATSNQSSFSH
jgi:hypothetical protein